LLRAAASVPCPSRAQRPLCTLRGVYYTCCTSSPPSNACLHASFHSLVTAHAPHRLLHTPPPPPPPLDTRSPPSYALHLVCSLRALCAALCIRYVAVTPRFVLAPHTPSLPFTRSVRSVRPHRAPHVVSIPHGPPIRPHWSHMPSPLSMHSHWPPCALTARPHPHTCPTRTCHPSRVHPALYAPSSPFYAPPRPLMRPHDPSCALASRGE
jgi:hypothetical protein